MKNILPEKNFTIDMPLVSSDFILGGKDESILFCKNNIVQTFNK